MICHVLFIIYVWWINFLHFIRMWWNFYLLVAHYLPRLWACTFVYWLMRLIVVYFLYYSLLIILRLPFILTVHVNRWKLWSNWVFRYKMVWIPSRQRLHFIGLHFFFYFKILFGRICNTYNGIKNNCYKY